MNDLKIFENKEFGSIRILEIDGEMWFVGKDVAEALGYQNVSDAVSKHVDVEDKQQIAFRDLQNYGLSGFGTKGTNLINESGLYSLVMSSELPTAKQFKRWVTNEILPSIRKTGSYNSMPQGIELLALAVLEADKTINLLKADNSRLAVQNTIMTPKAEYFDDLVERNLLTNFRDTAKELKVGQRYFIKFLLEKKYVYRDKKGKIKPFAGHDDLFEIKEAMNEKTGWAGTQTLITPKGRETFRLLMI